MHPASARQLWRPWHLLLLLCGWLRAAGAGCTYPVHCPTQEEACPSVVCPGGATILELTTAAPQDTFVWPLWPPAAPTARRRRQAQAAVPTSFTDTGLVQRWDYSFARLTTTLTDVSYGLNVSGAESVVGLFENSTGLQSLWGTRGWDTRRLRNASRAFAGLPALTELDLSRWDTARLEDVSELLAGGSALTWTGVGGWTSLPSLSRFSGLFAGLGSDFREALTGWSTPALAPGSVDCTRLAPYTALGQAHWPAACSRSLFSALVRTTYPSTAAILTLSPAAGPGANFTVDWGDGLAPSSCVHADGAVCPHTYAAAGDYWLRLSGRVDGLRYVEGARVVDVVAWGDVRLYHPVGTTTPLFTWGVGGYQLRYLAPTAGSRALHGVAPEYLLYWMSEFVGDARDWDWSWLTPATHPNGFRGLFQGCVKFNQDLDGWNTSGVARLRETFSEARAFNGSIGGWDTSQVTSLVATFAYARAFNQQIGGWNTSRAEACPPVACPGGATILELTTAAPHDTFVWPLWPPAAPAGPTSFVVDWGDGSPPTPCLDAGAAPCAHTYALAGTYTVTADPRGRYPVRGWALTPAWHATASAGLRLNRLLQWGELRFHETSGYHLYAAPGLTYVPSLAWLPDAGLVRSWDYSFARLTTPLPDLSYGLNLSGAVSAVGLFEGSTGLRCLDGTQGWDTRRLRNASRAFANLPALATLDLSRWHTAALEDVSELLAGGAALTWTGIGGWTSLPGLRRFDQLLAGVSPDFRELEAFARWGTPALAPGSVDCTRLAPYAALGQAHWPAACSRSLFLALVRVSYPSAVVALALSPAAGPGAAYGVGWGTVCNHTYTGAGDYWLRLSGRVDGLWYVAGAEVVEVVAWGDVQLYHPVGSGIPLLVPPELEEWGALRYLAPTAGSRALRGVAPEYLLIGMGEFVGDARDWDWSWLTPATHPQGFLHLFYGCAKFNQDLDGWNTSGVASLASTFQYASAFNGSLGGWDTSQVTSLGWTFSGARAFNRPIGGWNTSRVTSLQSTFNKAYAFNQPLGGWDVSRSWDYSFARLTATLPDLSYGLNMSGAESVVGLFEGSTGLTGLYGTGVWDTRRLRNASRAFAGLPALMELDLSRWDTARLEDVSELFAGSAALTRTGVGGWTSLPSLSRFSGLFTCLGSNFRESLAGWSTPALAPGSADCTRLARYTALGQAHWPAACSRSLFLALVRTQAPNVPATLTLSPAAGPGANFTVDWGDGLAPGSCAHANGAVCPHVYASAGDYWLRLSGRVDGLWYVEGAFVVEVVAWGDVQLYHPVGSTTPLFTRAVYAYVAGAQEYLLRYLAPTAGSRALHGVAPEYLLIGMSEFVGDARDWDWSWLTPATHPNGFSSLFRDCAKFNQDLDGWNTSGVASLDSAFAGARAFNGSLGGWNTSQVSKISQKLGPSGLKNQVFSLDPDPFFEEGSSVFMVKEKEAKPWKAKISTGKGTGSNKLMEDYMRQAMKALGKDYDPVEEITLGVLIGAFCLTLFRF
eukprot:g72505.t1